MSILQIVQICTSPLRWELPSEVTTPSAQAGKGGLWVDPVAFLQITGAWTLAEWALNIAQRLRPWALPPPKGLGRPRIYSDVSVLLTSLVAAAWQLSYETITTWLTRYDALAVALGYQQLNANGQRQTISLAQYSRRVRALGLLPYFLFFVALVMALIRLGVIEGWDLIIDSSYLAAWYKKDPDAGWSHPFKKKPRIFGYKIHSVICRWSYLPLFFVITPANAADGPLAIPLLAATVLLYGLKVWIVRADAAYFNYAFLGFVRNVLGASPVVDYNLRRKGKRSLADFFFLRQWKTAMGPRSNIERCFAFLKRYYGLANFQVKGLEAVTSYALQVHIAMLIDGGSHCYLLPTAGTRDFTC